MFLQKSLGIQAVGRLLIVFINTAFTFANSFIFSDEQLMHLVQMSASVILLTTIFELGSSRMMMKNSLNEDMPERQFQLHFTYIFSNAIIMLVFLFGVAVFLPMFRESYYFCLVIVALSLVFLFPHRLLALKSRADWHWVQYEFIVSSIFIVFSLCLYLGNTVSGSLPFVAAFYAAVALYVTMKRSPKLHFSLNHLKKDVMLVVEAAATSFFLNGIAFWNLEISERSQYFVIRLLSAPKILASLYINNVYQVKKNDALLGLISISIIICLGFGLQYFGFIGDHTLPYLIWLSVFFYVVVVWISNILKLGSMWWLNFLTLSTVQIMYYIFNANAGLMFLLVFLISGWSYFVLLRKH